MKETFFKRPLVLVLPKRSEYFKPFNQTLISFHIEDKKLLEEYKIIWTKIKDLNNIELNALPGYDDTYKSQNKNIW